MLFSALTEEGAILWSDFLGGLSLPQRCSLRLLSCHCFDLLPSPWIPGLHKLPSRNPTGSSLVFTLPGCSDLQAQGPIPWRNEIGTAIQACSKFIAMIDKQYLLSFNCLEVGGHAFHTRR